VGTPNRFPELRNHWDFEFIFRGDASGGEPPSHRAWKELRFVDLKRTPKGEVARSHADVLENAGYTF
jgi:hypothetical protein